MNNSRYSQIKEYFPYLKCPEKYTGSRPITMRSGWEIKFVKYYLDVNTNIVEWKSEVPIKYILASDGRQHTYYLDFWFRAKTKSGATKEFLVEIKPYAETLEPSKPKRMTKSFQYKLQTYIKNKSKWNQVELMVESEKKNGRDIEFLTLTEKDCRFFVS